MRRPARRAPPTPALAKFSRPRLYNVQKRERLFRLLDAHRTHPIVWIAGPPGPASPRWSRATSRRASCPASGSRRTRATRILREFFALFPANAMLVVDNFHEPKGEPGWRFAFAEGLREIPEGMNILFLPREPPPPEMSRLIGEQRITRIDWEERRFTVEESEAMTASARDPQGKRRLGGRHRADARAPRPRGSRRAGGAAARRPTCRNRTCAHSIASCATWVPRAGPRRPTCRRDRFRRVRTSSSRDPRSDSAAHARGHAPMQRARMTRRERRKAPPAATAFSVPGIRMVVMEPDSTPSPPARAIAIAPASCGSMQHRKRRAKFVF